MIRIFISYDDFKETKIRNLNLLLVSITWDAGRSRIGVIIVQIYILKINETRSCNKIIIFIH